MSRATTAKYTLSLIALATSAACASTPAATPEEQAYQSAIENALLPASQAEIDRANRSDPITRASFWSNEYQKDATNIDTTVSFMNALRGIGSHDRVLEIATTAIPMHPGNYELYLELGRSFMAQGKLQDAGRAFMRSADLSPETDATPLAALGLALDRLEDHQEAQKAYRIALERQPDRVSTLSNYGLSLALTGQLDQAEIALRKAVEAPGADVRVRQNLALILGLQGRFDEMSAVDPNAPPRSIEANQRALREMIAPGRNYDDLQQLDDVIDDLERTPAEAQEMPKVAEANVSSESMQDPVASAHTPTPETELAGEREPPPPAKFRPTLRGTQGR